MRGDRTSCAGTHLGAGFNFPAFLTVERELSIPGFELYRFFSVMADLNLPVFFLESLTESENARYSIMGFDPLILVEYRNGLARIAGENGECEVRQDLFAFLRNFLQSQPGSRMRRAGGFSGGFVGFWGYGIGLEQERIERTLLPATSVPDAAFFFPRVTVVHDRYSGRIRVRGFYQDGAGEKYKTSAKVDQVAETLALTRASPSAASPLSIEKGLKMPGDPDSEFTCNTAREEFIEMVRKAKEYIRIGDAFQIVLSQRWKKQTRASPLEVYHELRRINPSPYMFYLRFPSFTLVGASPEMLVKVQGDLVETKPIAGTRPVTGDRDRDEILCRELVNDEKEKAEHLMLVDLGRNDVGKVSRPGTIRVSEFMKLEAYSHVVHLVSKIQGRLRDGMDCLDALQACFPAGTLTGAPKHRAMEIIESLEKGPRGPYGGAVGYVGVDGSLDSCITIRSVLFKGQHCYIQAGAGIVADSVPENEYQETVNKAKALMEAVLRAEGRE